VTPGMLSIASPMSPRTSGRTPGRRRSAPGPRGSHLPPADVVEERRLLVDELHHVLVGRDDDRLEVVGAARTASVR
jgi:hypothetical protein